MEASPKLIDEQKESTQLAKGTIINALGIAAKASRALYLVVFSRLLGIEGFGLYMLAFAVQEVIGKIAVLGLDWGGMRLIGVMKGQGADNPTIRNAIYKVALLGFGASFVVAVLLAILAHVISSVFLNKPELALPLQAFCFGMPLYATTSILVYTIRPSLDMRWEVYVRSILEPLSILILGALALIFGFGITGAIFAHNISYLATLIMAFVFVRKIYPGSRKGVSASIKWKVLANSSFSMGGMEFLNNFKLRLDLMVIGRLLPLSLVGVYGAVVEIANLIRKLRAAFDPILMPITQELHQRGDKEKLRENMALAVRWVLVPCLAFLGPMLLIPEAFMEVFGKDFVVGATCLMIFSIGPVFFTTLGLAEGVLAITGYGYVTLINVVVMVLLNLMLLILLIPIWGINGAALATTISFVAITLWRLFQMRQLLGVWPFSPSQLKPLYCFGLAFLLIFGLMRVWPNTEFLFLLGCGISFLVVYGLLLYLFGLDPYDLSLLGKIKGRIQKKIPFFGKKD
jgi:O-antigen/teichoic acid export membrane protein